MQTYDCIELSNVDGIAVAKLIDEKIMDTDRIQTLNQELMSLAEAPENKRILVNLENVRFLSSAAISKLIVLNKRLKGVGGTIKICNVQPEVREVFTITQLDQIFDIMDGQQEAIDSFESE